MILDRLIVQEAVFAVWFLIVCLQGDILVQTHRKDQTELLSVLGDMPQACLGDFPRSQVRDRFAIQLDGPTLSFSEASDSLDQFALTVPIDSGDSDDFAGPYRKIQISHRFQTPALFDRQSFDFQNSLFRLRWLFDCAEQNGTPHHHVGQFLLGCLLHIDGADALALADNRAAVCHCFDFIQFMRNQDDRLAFFRQFPHDRHQFVDFLRCQYCRWFVKNKDVRPTVQCFQDFDPLLHTDSGIFDFG